MKFQDFATEYRKRYDNPESGADGRTVISLIASAEKLSPSAQSEFVKMFDYDFALDGVIYGGSQISAKINMPNLLAEADTAGIKIVYRGGSR